MSRSHSHRSVAYALARARAHRARMRRRRRRLVALAAAPLLCIVTGLTIAEFAGADIVAAADAKARSLSDLLSERSPGARTDAQLTKTKILRKPIALLAPAEEETQPLAALLAPPASSLVPVDIAPPPAELALVAPPPIGAIIFTPNGPGNPGSPGGPGGPGVPGGPGTPPTTLVITPPPAVPEPGTWITMIAGFAVAAWRLRRVGSVERCQQRGPANAE